jgi:hypothetical protein
MPPVATTKTELSEEAARLIDILRDKTVKTVWRHRPGELGIEFTDGTRLFVDHHESGLELSVTGT